MPTRFVRLAIAMAAAILFAVAIAPPPVEAHAEYQRSSPPADGRVAAAPPRLDVWFTAELFRRTGEHRLTVTGPTGEPAQAGNAVIDDADRKHLSVALKRDLPTGTYTVNWATLSAQDGENAEGTFTFTVDSSASGPTTSPTAPAPTAALSAATAPATTESPAGTSSSGGTTNGRIPWWAVGAAAAILMSTGITAITILRGGHPR
jgi:copper resistance protein C